MMRKRNGSKRDAPAEVPLPRSGDVLQAKNHKLAKELSECRMKHREEAKNVSRLTMENMNLASRCREAIAQAAALKKELSIQKKKTAEAVHQTHQLIAQLKKMSPERQERKAVMVTPDVVTPTTIMVIEADDSEHKEDDIVEVVQQQEEKVPEEPLKKADSPVLQSPPRLVSLVLPTSEEPVEVHHKPDAPASSEEDLEETDTVPETIPEKPVFPVTASPISTSRKKTNDSYDEEYPEEPTVGKKPESSLLSSIDAFEASFSTSFPESFSPKDEDEESAGLYNPFDTTSPVKGDPPTKNLRQPVERTLSPKSTTTSPTNVVTYSTKNHILSPKSGLEMSPRDTPPRKMSRQQEEKTSLLVKALPLSLDMVELVHEETPTSSKQGPSPDSPDIEVVSPNGQTNITPVMSPSSSVSSRGRNGVKSSYEMVGLMSRSPDVPDDETGTPNILPSRLRSTRHRVGPTSDHKPVELSRFKKTLAVSTSDTTRQLRGAPLSSRSNGSFEASSPTQLKNSTDTSNRFQRAARTHVGSAASIAREIKARNRSVSAPRVRTTPPSLTFPENPERPQKLTGYGAARARYERAIQSPKDDLPLDGRQRRNVNLSNRRRADFGNGASPLVSSPKSFATTK